MIVSILARENFVGGGVTFFLQKWNNSSSIGQVFKGLQRFF